MTLVFEVGDVLTSKFGNRWVVEAHDTLADDTPTYVLRNRLEEAPDAVGTVTSGPLPEWAESARRNGRVIWKRPTPRCECPSYAKAKGPYPSGFCPECKLWYPGIDRAKAIELGHIQPPQEPTP